MIQRIGGHPVNEISSLPHVRCIENLLENPQNLWVGNPPGIKRGIWNIPLFSSMIFPANLHFLDDVPAKFDDRRVTGNSNAQHIGKPHLLTSILIKMFDCENPYTIA